MFIDAVKLTVYLLEFFILGEDMTVLLTATVFFGASEYGKYGSFEVRENVTLPSGEHNNFTLKNNALLVQLASAIVGRM